MIKREYELNNPVVEVEPNRFSKFLMKFDWIAIHWKIILGIPLAVLFFSKTFKDIYDWSRYKIKAIGRKNFPAPPPAGPGAKSQTKVSFELMGEHFEHPEHIFIRNLRKYMGKVVELVLQDPECNREGLNFLDRLLHNEDTAEAANKLLVNVL
jgi:hypothetical protein